MTTKHRPYHTGIGYSSSSFSVLLLLSSYPMTSWMLGLFHWPCDFKEPDARILISVVAGVVRVRAMHLLYMVTLLEFLLEPL